MGLQEYELLRSILLTKARAQPVDREKYEKRVFRLDVPKRPYFFQAESAAEMHAWVGAINVGIRIHVDPSREDLSPQHSFSDSGPGINQAGQGGGVQLRTGHVPSLRCGSRGRTSWSCVHQLKLEGVVLAWWLARPLSISEGDAAETSESEADIEAITPPGAHPPKDVVCAHVPHGPIGKRARLTSITLRSLSHFTQVPPTSGATAAPAQAGPADKSAVIMSGYLEKQSSVRKVRARPHAVC